MAKHRKTLKQKLAAELRHETYSLKSQNIILSNTPVNKTATALPVNSSNLYLFLISDLRKTAILTLSIVAFQIILFFLLKHRVIMFPGISY
ncbi:MAG: hypothetical protein Q7R31_04820 [Candidatus Levybacteria bacterium]|nr:hypothetical protein [Candidatus Levybacteria bacterium]